jgi:SHS family lactate transporter-like MFS transporter
LADTSALENVPVPARGLLSGIMQGGYTLGYVLAAVANLALTDRYGWKSVFYCGGAISLLAAIIRAALPESRQYILAREQLKAEGLTGKQTARIFFKEFKAMIKVNWLRCIWGVCLMTGFNYLAHGSQDLYVS